LAAYARGENVEAIIAEYGSYGALYRWLERLDIPLRDEYRRKPKPGAKRPTVYNCQWCDDALCRKDIKRRRHYCSDECRAKGYSAHYQDLRDKRAADGDVKYCMAPGCGVEFWSDKTYCCKKCAEAAIKARTVARAEEILKLSNLPTRIIADRLDIKIAAVRYRLNAAKREFA
jgi:hypothetical protein